MATQRSRRLRKNYISMNSRNWAFPWPGVFLKARLKVTSMKP